MVVINYQDQLQSGTFEHAIQDWAASRIPFFSWWNNENRVLILTVLLPIQYIFSRNVLVQGIFMTDIIFFRALIIEIHDLELFDSEQKQNC
jgi:hypothetical protein